MTTSELTELLSLIQTSPNSDRLTATVLKLAADSAALKTVKNRPISNTDSKQKNYLKFTKQEIENMSEKLKQILLIYGGNLVTYHFHNGSYESRYRRDGYDVRVYAHDIKTLKTKFLNAMATATPVQKEDTRFPYMRDFVPEWLKIKKIEVKESTFKSYIALIDVHVLPPFGDRRINLITRNDIQEYLTDLVEKEKFRTAEKLKQLLCAMFDIAVEDYSIKSPMTKITLPHYETKKGKALTKAEEKILVEYCLQNIGKAAASAVLLLLYTGMRVGELKTATLYEKYIECETGKIRKGYATEYRKIPISPMLRKHMPVIDFENGIKASPDQIKTFLKGILSEHHTHELRYTFITRAKESGCNLELVMLWDGHKFDEHVKSSAVDRGYTTYSDEYYFGEIEKINYEL